MSSGGGQPRRLTRRRDALIRAKWPEYGISVRWPLVTRTQDLTGTRFLLCMSGYSGNFRFSSWPAGSAARQLLPLPNTAGWDRDTPEIVRRISGNGRLKVEEHFLGAGSENGFVAAPGRVSALPRRVDA